MYNYDVYTILYIYIYICIIVYTYREREALLAILGALLAILGTPKAGCGKNSATSERLGEAVSHFAAAGGRWIIGVQEMGLAAAFPRQPAGSD